MFSPILVGFQWKYIFNDNIGLLNNFLREFGVINPIPWLVDATLANFSIMAAEIWSSTSVFAILLLAGLMGIPKDPIDVSTIHVPVTPSVSTKSKTCVVEVGAKVVGTSVVEVGEIVVGATVDVLTTEVVVVVGEVNCAAEAICIADSMSGGGGALSRRRNHHPARAAKAIRVIVVKTSFFVMYPPIYL